jgi:predicted CXXCH cytochrome family protein
MQEVLFYIRGWKDTFYTAQYDDPLNDNRALFKLHIQLVAGNNMIYFANASGKAHALEYSTTYGTECPPTASRPTHFHNSPFEQNCVPCHEGLPSGLEGKSTTAECSVCHKEKFNGTYLHSPVEMKECTSCHSWSAEQKLVVVEAGIPENCYTCHSDISDTVTTAAFPHVVASECLTCHSPHTSGQPHQLKKDVYSLCVSCHQDKTLNHPVGRHPLRFVTYGEKNEELSCVSCHNPHGSSNEKLARVGGGTMAMCEQ